MSPTPGQGPLSEYMFCVALSGVLINVHSENKSAPVSEGSFGAKAEQAHVIALEAREVLVGRAPSF